MGKTFVFAGDQAVGQVVSQKLQEAGLSLAEGFSTADYIFTYCLTQGQLEDLYLGTDGAVESAGEGCCLVDLSPSTMTLAKEIYAIARVNELQALDAPLVLKDPCGHDGLADRGNVMLLVGGEDGAFSDAKPLLHLFAGDVRLLGPAGCGQLAKAMCTMQAAASAISLVEARALAESMGEAMPDAVSAAVDADLAAPGARAFYDAMVSRHYHGSYTCQLLLAELLAVVNGADEGGLVLPQVEACQRIIELLVVVGGADRGLPALSLLYAGDEEGRAHGLDWARAEGIYAQEGHHAHDDGLDGGYEFGDGDYHAGFDGFSAN